ncbi:MAG: ABC transporter permease, partial [Acidobacteriota bacterium]
PDEVTAVFTSDFSSGDFGASSYPDYIDFRDRNQSLAGLVAYQPRPFSLNTDGSSERAFGEIVSGNYFSVLGVNPVLGRGFLPEEDKTPGAHPVVVISHRLWQERYQSDPAIIGRTLKLNATVFTIVGVGKKGYSGLLRGFGGDLWVPAMMMEQVSPGSGLTERGDRSFMLMGRLKPEVTIEQARADFRLIAEQQFRTWPERWANIRNQSRVISLLPENQSRLLPDFRTPVAIFMTLLMAVVGLVLLIACANVANLLLARATTRRKEIAIRLSLGASRGRLIRQLLTESVLLALMGGIAGSLISVWAMRLLSNFRPSVGFPVILDLSPDWRVFAFTFAACLVTGVLFGLAPSLAATRSDLVSSLKDETSMGGASRGRGKLRSALVVVQVALSLLLLICAGLFLRSLLNAGSIDPGFTADNLLTMSMDLSLQGYEEPAGKNFSREMLERVRSLPGIESAALAEYLPLGAGAARRGITIEGYTAQPGESTEVGSVVVGPGYFDTLRMPLLQGRPFNEGDREGAPGVVMINETFARRYWPGQNPLGKRIQMGSGKSNDSPHLEVVGLVRDGKYVTLGEDPIPFFYLNMLQRYQAAPTLIVRTQGDPLSQVAAVRSEISVLDKNLPLTDVQTMRQHLGLALFPARLAGIALGIFGLVALLLAAAGLYGVMAYSVAQRTREIGVRMALGAASTAVLRLVIWHGLKLVLIGMVIGLAAAFAVTHLMTSLLYGVSATDPLTFVVIALLLGLVALGASWIPARRATRVDPMVALRYG